MAVDEDCSDEDVWFDIKDDDGYKNVSEELVFDTIDDGVKLTWADGSSALRLQMTNDFSNKNNSTHLFESFNLRRLTTLIALLLVRLFVLRFSLVIWSWSRFNSRPCDLSSLRPIMNEACITSFKLLTTSSIESRAFSTITLSLSWQHLRSSFKSSWYLLIRCTGLRRYVSNGSFSPRLNWID